ncbi:DUF6795 domain-containing protein [Pseudocolwellia sp. HL-MZ19]|uniref:DUF6795 domain-containing protein n=1 Tax=Pseudocolwellia sp. HL-MZ19 TaxID=3400846 RepID=UPI003CF42879
MFSFFKKTKVQLSPFVKGRITDNGQPLPGLEVVRELFYSGYDKENAIIDYALTNTNGEFSFDEKIVKSHHQMIFLDKTFLYLKIYILKKKLMRMKVNCFYCGEQVNIGVQLHH